MFIAVHFRFLRQTFQLLCSNQISGMENIDQKIFFSGYQRSVFLDVQNIVLECCYPKLFDKYKVKNLIKY